MAGLAVAGRENRRSAARAALAMLLARLDGACSWAQRKRHRAFDKLPYFRSIERVRYRRTVHPGDVVVIEATVRRLRRRVGVLRGIARVNGTVVVEGTMTFALGPQQTTP